MNRQDHEEFLQYQKEKEARERLRKEQVQAVAVSQRKVGRRNFLTVVAGTAAVGEAAVLGYSVVKDQIPATARGTLGTPTPRRSATASSAN